ncbi:MAG: trehalose-phosphatase [Woeseiaceae bacterium]|nr:trehalose-phosphatase [Woeseiaceae bacterium]
MQIAPADIDPAASALFLDVDGTLLELESRPGDVRADPVLIRLLQALESRLDGALCLVSGRPVADIDRIFAPVRFPAAGAHGGELRVADGAPVDTLDAPLPRTVTERLAAFVAEHEGLLLETKSAGAALHYRNAPALENACRSLLAELGPDIGDEHRLIDGKMVLELAPRDQTKGEAIRKMLHHVPFRGRRPVFVGDDVTDEDGFRAVNALAGIAVRVGGDDPTAARYRLPDVAAVRAWLEAIAGAPDSQ